MFIVERNVKKMSLMFSSPFCALSYFSCTNRG